MSLESEWAKKKYADDPVYRARRLASNAAYKQSHKQDIADKRASKKEDPTYVAREREGRRKSSFKKLYGITVEDYDAMLARQGGKCKICKKKSDKLLFVDHCHGFLVVRGLL